MFYFSPPFDKIVRYFVLLPDQTMEFEGLVFLFHLQYCWICSGKMLELFWVLVGVVWYFSEHQSTSIGIKLQILHWCKLAKGLITLYAGCSVSGWCLSWGPVVEGNKESDTIKSDLENGSLNEPSVGLLHAVSPRTAWLFCAFCGFCQWTVLVLETRVFAGITEMKYSQWMSPVFFIM